MAKKDEVKEEVPAVIHSDVDTALWALYNSADKMKQEVFNRKYKVIEQIVNLEKSRLTKQEGSPKEGAFFDNPPDGGKP